MSSILFAKHVSFEHSVSSPRPVITSRREEKSNKAKVFQHPIDSHSQSASSCLISPHFGAGAVGVGRGAASFLSLATESTGTVLIPRLMTRIAGHEQSRESNVGYAGPSTSWPFIFRALTSWAYSDNSRYRPKLKAICVRSKYDWISENKLNLVDQGDMCWCSG